MTWDDLDDEDLARAWRDLQRPKKELEWVDDLLRPPAEPSERRAGRGLIQDYLRGRLEDTRGNLSELQQELYVRRRLHEQSTDQLDYQISRAALALEQFRGWATGYNRGVDEKRIELERTLRDLRKEKRASRLRLWDDVVRLRTEVREKRREYESARRRAELQFG